MHNLFHMLRKKYWTTVSVYSGLQALLAGVLEYIFSGGLSGLVPLVAGLGGVIIAVVVLSFFQVPEPGKSGNDRIFIDKSPLELTKQVEGITAVASKYIVERYKGAWMKAQGKIENIFDWGGTLRVFTSRTEIKPWFTLIFKK